MHLSTDYPPATAQRLRHVHPESPLEINAFCLFQVAILGAHTLNDTKAIRGWKRGRKEAKKQSTGLICYQIGHVQILISSSFALWNLGVVFGKI